MTLGLLLSLSLAQSTPSLSLGRSYVTALRRGEEGGIWNRSRAALGQQFTLPSLSKFGAALRSYGTETKVVVEGIAERNGSTVYRRVMAVSNWARGLELELTLDARGRLLAGHMSFPTKEAPTTYGNYRSLVKLELPLLDTWQVLWGGRSWEENRHASVSDMRFAVDLLQVKHGSSAQGSGKKNEDYFAWDQPVNAPADGVVVVAEDGVVDNVPNRAVGGNLYGNVLVIDHGTEEFTLLGHLRQGSLLVKAGERVSKGQRLARVGNSGMSTEPHLHFQLMDGPDWRTAHGLPLQLHGFVRNGTLVDRAEPRRGEVLTAVSVEARR